MTDIKTLDDILNMFMTESTDGTVAMTWTSKELRAGIKQALNLYIEERERLAYGRGTIDTLDHVKEWADKTEVTYNDMMSERIKELEG